MEASSTIAGTVVQCVVWLGAIAAVLVIVTRMLGQRARLGQSRTIALTSQHAVHLVAIEGRRFLVGTGPAGPPRLLHELAAETAEPTGRDAFAQDVTHRG